MDASVAKLAPCLKFDPIDCKYGLRNGTPIASAATDFLWQINYCRFMSHKIKKKKLIYT